jgi:diacylglycerol kinase
MNKHKNLLHSWTSAGKGMRHGIIGKNFQLLLVLALLTLGLAYYFPLSLTERFFIVALIGLVLMAELFNSAIEELSDVLIQEQHPGIARVKELASAGVSVIIIVAGVIGIWIFYPYLFV